MVYFEKQSNDRLCGLHAINSLLQAPYFTEFDLSEIGQRLDDEEKKLLDELSLSQQKSQNVDLDGNFNVQVIQEALGTVGAEVFSWKSEKMINEIGNQDDIDGIIFNSSTHWFTIRRVEGVWFNLNSTNPLPGPQIISDFYLSAFIESTYEMQYTNFVVRKLPQLLPFDNPVYANLMPWQHLVVYQDIVNSKNKQLNMEDSDSEQLKKAIELSKQEAGEQVVNLKMREEPSQMQVEDQILQDDIARMVEESKKEFLKQIEDSIPPEPQGEGVDVLFQTDSGQLERKFNWTDTIGNLKNWLRVKFGSNSEIELRQNMPPVVFSNEEQTLKDAGMETKQLLFARII